MKKKTTGSGWGEFKKGKRILHISQVKKGDLLLVFSRQFNAKNVVVVTQTEFEFANGQKIYVQFVNPQKPSEPRTASNGNMCIWDFMVGQPKTKDSVLIDDFWVAKGEIPVMPEIAISEDDEEEIDEVDEPVIEEKIDPNQLPLFSDAA